jgi:hypothetical protein
MQILGRIFLYTHSNAPARMTLMLPKGNGIFPSKIPIHSAPLIN